MVIKLASNENPYGRSPRATEAITAELATLSLYPDGSSADLTAELADQLGIERNQIIFGCGSDEIIALIIRAFLEPGDETIMADQTFSVYKTNADIEGARSIEVPLVNGKHDLPGMAKPLRTKPKSFGCAIRIIRPEPSFPRASWYLSWMKSLLT